MFQALVEVVAGFGSPRVAVMGDYMLDRYVYGDAEGISPEAPVTKVVERQERTGGAGSVAAGVLALGGKVACVGAVGQDEAGDELNRLLVTAGAETAGLLRLPERATTVRTRYVGPAQQRHRQKVLRVAEESPASVPPGALASLRTALLATLGGCDVLAIQDYDEGVFTDENAPQIIADAAGAGVPVVVHPATGVDYARYEGATVLAGNRRPIGTQAATGVEIADDASLDAAARRIIDITGAEAVVITLDRDGAYLLARRGPSRRISTRPRSVYDPAGAGDEMLAMLAVAVAEKCGYADAVALANLAGGLEVERFGFVPVGREELIDELRRMIGLRGGKVLARDGLAGELARRRRRGETVVFTNGCFDLLHPGHVRHLQQARELGSCLVVAINSDDSVRRLKGPSRPIIGAQERADTLAALECVDYVTVFDEDTPEELLKLLTPDILVKGGTTGLIVGQQIVEGYGGRVVKLPAVEGLSTTEIINRIVDNSGGG